MTIREITDQYLQIMLQRLEAPDIEVPQLLPDGSNAEEVAALTAEKELYEKALEDTFAMIQEDFVDKADGYGTVYSQVMADIAAVKKEKARLTGVLSSLERKAERLKNAMKSAMEITDQKTVKGQLYTFSIRHGAEVRVDVPSVYLLPDDMVRYSDPVPDKVAIRSWLKSHPETPCPWAHMEPTTSLIIK